MDTHPKLENLLSEFLIYLADFNRSGKENFPTLSDLSKELGISVSSIREQLQVAKSMGLVEIRPRRGIRARPYAITPAITKCVAFGISVDLTLFADYSDLRNHLESCYWHTAVSKLTPGDVTFLGNLVDSAFKKLNSSPIQIPHYEHRELHLSIFKRLDNPFVFGILEAYWDLYEAVGLSFYEDRAYLGVVWTYHKQMVEAIDAGDYIRGYHALITHMDLITKRTNTTSQSLFE